VTALLIALDGIEDVNDAFGRATSDALLVAVAARLALMADELRRWRRTWHPSTDPPRRLDSSMGRQGARARGARVARTTRLIDYAALPVL
jgi:hypothetical protein